MSWTDERVETLKRMWGEGQSASQIAKELGGVTRNAVIGKVHRLGLSNRAGGKDEEEEAPTATAAPAASVRPEPAAARPEPAPRPEPARPAAPAAAGVASNVTQLPVRKPIIPAGQPLPRSPCFGPRSREARAQADADGTDRTDLQVADRRPGDR
jgi:GcrA cell cycle regulator